MQWNSMPPARAALFWIALVASPATWAAATPLVVGIPEGLPGYELVDGNHLKISDPYKRKVTKCIAGRLNATFVWKAYPTKRVIQMLQSRDVDMVYPMGFTKERSASMLQSSVTWQNPDVIVSLRPVDLHQKNMRVAARLGSPQQTDYLADGYSNMTPAYAYEDLARLLANGSVDMVVVPQSVFSDQKALWPPNVVVTAGKPRSSGFYLNNDDPKGLLKPLNESIAQCTDPQAGK
jgi:ABC-type amino acid transport substrate-binding protein